MKLSVSSIRIECLQLRELVESGFARLELSVSSIRIECLQRFDDPTSVALVAITFSILHSDRVSATKVSFPPGFDNI